MNAWSRKMQVWQAGFSDAQYIAVGVEISTTAAALTEASDVIVKVRPPSVAESQ